MKMKTKIALVLTTSLISGSVFAQTVTAPETDSLLNNIFVQQSEANQLLKQLVVKAPVSEITLTDAQRKTSCLYENKYYSTGAPLTVGTETLRCTLSGEIPTWKNANDGNIVAVEGK